MIQEPDEREHYTVRIADQMEARLTGEAFDITPITTEAQGMNLQGITEWKWDIRPKKIGPQRLHLTLDAKLRLFGRDVTHNIRTFDHTMDVKVVWPQSALFFWQNYWQWICTTIAIPMAGWLAVCKWRSEKKGA